MKIFTTIFIFLIATTAFGQKITGKVTLKSGAPIAGVNITNLTLNKSTTSDFDGSFVIDGVVGHNIKFSMIGLVNINRKATGFLSIIMSESAQDLNEVVLIGYGSRKKGAVTGSVSQIKSSEILKTPNQSAIQSIQGKAAGINIVTNDEPGAKPTITIRGLGTILGARSPLYVIDGIESESLNGISANDIETLDLLKDASSTAIYGQKGVNGVVIITTKRFTITIVNCLQIVTLSLSKCIHYSLRQAQTDI